MDVLLIFFNELDAAVFKTAMQDLNNELERTNKRWKSSTATMLSVILPPSCIVIQILEKNVRKWLHDAQLDRLFTQADVGDDIYHAKFPFVQQQDPRPVKVINLKSSVGHAEVRVCSGVGQGATPRNSLLFQGVATQRYVTTDVQFSV